MGLIATKLGTLYNEWVNGNARILLLGLNAAGKTTILYRLKLNEVIETNVTIGFNVEEVSPIKNVTFTMWDIGYRQQLTPLVKHYFPDTDGIIFVMDASADKDRQEDARDYILKTLKSEDLPRGVPVMIMANKQDKPNALKKNEIIELLNLYTIRHHPWHVQEVCALSGNGLIEGIQTFSDMVRKFQINRTIK